MNQNVVNVQEAIDHYAARVFDLEELEAVINKEKASHLTRIANHRAALAHIDREFEQELATEKENVSETKEELDALVDYAWESGDFPNGKKKLPLENGAYVQVTERVTYKVKDPSEVIRWALDKGIEDTLIKSVTLNKDATKGAWSLFGKIRGVEQQQKTTVSIKLPKEGK